MGNGHGGITAFFAPILRVCTGHACIGFLLILHEVRLVCKPRNQFHLTSSSHPISYHPTWTSEPLRLQTDHHGPTGPESPFNVANMTCFRECGHQHVQSIEHILSK